jgi:uncharacterized damage-inducible protein DinB
MEAKYVMDALNDGLRQVLGGQKQAMREVVSGLSVEALNWQPGDGKETNSIAQMLSHALEAERFLLATAVDATVDRAREAQFQVTVNSADELTSLIDRSEQQVNGYLDQLTPEMLSTVTTRSDARGDRTFSGAWWLLHAVEHSREHIGQALLTRQLFEAQ